MTHWAIGLLAAVALHGAPQAPGSLEPLAFLVGHCWKGTFPDGKRTDEHCFEWVFDRTYIRDRHVVEGESEPYRGETLFAIEKRSGRIIFWYWNSRGDVTTGSVEPTGEELIFPELLETKSGTRQLRTVWRRSGHDRFQLRVLELKGEAWVELWHMTMVR